MMTTVLTANSELYCCDKNLAFSSSLQSLKVEQIATVRTKSSTWVTYELRSMNVGTELREKSISEENLRRQDLSM